MDRALQPETATINHNTCSTCKKMIDIHLLYKTCLPCRAKAKTRREKLKMQRMGVRADMDVLYRQDDLAGQSTKGHQGNAYTTYRDESRKAVAGVKKKAEKSLSELEGEEQKVAMRMIKTSLKKTIRRNGKKPLSIPTVGSAAGGQEYQNASSLYDVLKVKVFSSYPANNDGIQFLQFHGSHSIVAVSSINNIKRINLVATDLRKIARLSFELANAILTPGPSGSVTLSYPCNCFCHIRSMAISGTDKPKGSGPGSLIRWARADFKPTPAQAVPRTCRGEVSITVSDDKTHSLKILGQRIIVRVEHPIF